MTPEEEQAIRDSVKWSDLPRNLLPPNEAYRTRCDQLLEAMQDLAVANAKLSERDATIATLREALNKTLVSATEGTRIAQERITTLCAEIATIQSNAADNYAAAENRAHEAVEIIKSLLASAMPNPKEHPTMTRAWNIANRFLEAIAKSNLIGEQP